MIDKHYGLLGPVVYGEPHPEGISLTAALSWVGGAGETDRTPHPAYTKKGSTADAVLPDFKTFFGRSG